MLAVLTAGACGLGPNPARATSQASAPAPATATVPPAPTATEAPTNTAEPSPTLEPTEAVTASATIDPLAPTATLAAAITPGAAGANAAEFVADVTVPDGTNFTPGEAFVKTWRLKNVGTSTWGEGYLITYAKGEQMGGPQTLALPSSVPPGGTVDGSPPRR